MKSRVPFDEIVFLNLIVLQITIPQKGSLEWRHPPIRVGGYGEEADCICLISPWWNCVPNYPTLYVIYRPSALPSGCCARVAVAESQPSPSKGLPRVGLERNVFCSYPHLLQLSITPLRAYGDTDSSGAVIKKLIVSNGPREWKQKNTASAQI